MGCASYEGTNSLPAFVGRVLPEGTTRHADYRRLRERMLETLVQACQKTGWQVHAYCLIRKRFRLVVEGLKRMRWSEAELSGTLLCCECPDRITIVIPCSCCRPPALSIQRRARSCWLSHQPEISFRSWSRETQGTLSAHPDSRNFQTL
jgi:hypothetical protein